MWRSNRDAVRFRPPLRGRTAIVAAFQSYFDTQGEHAPGTFMRHLCTAPRIELFDGDVHVKTAMLSCPRLLPYKNRPLGWTTTSAV